jgi:hypothetical protein
MSDEVVLATTALLGQFRQVSNRKIHKASLIALFFSSRGVPAPKIMRRIRPRINAPTWISCRLRMFSLPRRWQRRRPTVS